MRLPWGKKKPDPSVVNVMNAVQEAADDLRAAVVEARQVLNDRGVTR